MAVRLGVVMVSASFHPYVGGAEKQALELSAALRLRGVDARVVTRRVPGLPAREEARGVPVERLWCVGGGALNSLTFLFSLYRYLRLQAPFYEAIHVHLAGSPALAAALAGRLSGKPVFVKLGGGKGIGELATSARTRMGRLKLRALRLLKPRFVAVAKELAQEAAVFLGGVTVHVVSNGVDTRRYRPLSNQERRQARTRMGWPEGLGFLYVGRLSPEKRLPQFIEAWADCARKSRTPSFVAFIGEGAEEFAIRSAARSSGTTDKVFFHKFMDDVSGAYGAADVFILPSISEGLSNSLLEAMACGLPALASAVGGTPEAVEEGRTGFLFAPQDVEELKGQIQKFLRRPELAAEMGRDAAEAVAAKFSLERVARVYEELYRLAAS